MEDTSLDEFAETTDESEFEDSSEAESEAETEIEQGTETVALDDVEPATVTSRAGNDEECSECAEPATRLWNDDGQFVCKSCKEW